MALLAGSDSSGPRGIQLYRTRARGQRWHKLGLYEKPFKLTLFEESLVEDGDGVGNKETRL